MFTIENFLNHQSGPALVSSVNNGKDLTGGGVFLIDNDRPRFDVGLCQPYLHNGVGWVDVTIGYEEIRNEKNEVVRDKRGLPTYKPIIEPQKVADRVRHGLPVSQVNNASLLSKDQWIKLDSVIQGAARARLRLWGDLEGAVPFGGFDGMATPILESEIMNDLGEAKMDMYPEAEGSNFDPEISITGMPLPVAHADFYIPERFLVISRTRGMAADTIREEMAGRRVGELIEKTAIGTVSGVQYGSNSDYYNTSKVYGLTNHPDRITYTSFTAPGSLTGDLFVEKVIAMRELAYTNNFFGPFMLYVSTSYDAKLDVDHKANSDKTIRQRALEIDGIRGIKRLDYLTSDTVLLVQLTPDVVQAVNGMEIHTIQWSPNPMKHCFKVLGIKVPRIRSVFKSGTSTRVTGIVHGTTS